MPLQVIRSARANYPVETYVGDKGQIFYREDIGDFRLSDGVTPGGIELASGGFSATFVANLPELLGADIDSGDFFILYDDSTDSLKKVRVDSLPTGYTGSQGDIGYTGSQGPIGFTGSGGSSNLVFSDNGDQRILTNYVDDDGETFTVRSTSITNGVFSLSLASFTPTLSATVLPAATLNWDQPVQSFRVTVTNPVDFPSRYISSVRSLEQISGSVSIVLEDYATTGPTSTPAGGVSWQQTFSTTPEAYIRSTSSTISGGSASALVRYNEFNLGEVEYTASTTTWTVNWNTPAVSVSLNNLSGNNFLQSYTATGYTITVTGISNQANYSLAVSGSGGSVSNVSGNGSLTFTDPIHKNNVADVRSVSVTATFNRPSSVTGTAYSVNLNATASSFSKSFLFPSFWVFTDSTGQPPTRSDLVLASNFRVSVNQLGNQAKVFSSTVSNSSGVPRVFWLGVRTSASQPTSFKTGASQSLLSDVAITQSSVSLGPDSVPSGYQLENYTLYGIILQPGSTYVSIS